MESAETKNENGDSFIAANRYLIAPNRTIIFPLSCFVF